MEFGTGANLLGDTSAIQEAMQRRGMGQINAQSSSSAGFKPSVAPPQMPSMPQGGMPQTQATPPIQGLPQESFEAQTIIEALSKRLDNDSKMRMKKLDQSNVMV